MELEKRTDQNFVPQNQISVAESNIAFQKKKKLLKQCLKEVIYEYILTFVGWWSIFWEVVGGGGYVLAGSGWWWIYFDWWWVVVDIFWMVVSSGGYILGGGGLW